MARAYAEMFAPRPFDLTTFPNDEGYDELVLARSIPVQSVCEHHLLPFVGVAHVGYLPGDRILGLSKLARVVEMFARRPQVQERLTQQVADWLQTNLGPRGVGVVIEAEHLCMTMRGVRAGGVSTVTSALHGHLREDAAARAEFFALALPRRRGPAPAMTDPPAPASSPANGYQGFRQGFLTTDTDPFTAQRREGATPEMAEHFGHHRSTGRIDRGRSVDLAGRPEPGPARLGQPGDPGPGPARRGGDHEPHDLRQGDHRQRRLRPPRSVTWPPAAPASPRRCGNSPPPMCGAPATCCGRCTTRPTASTGGSRSRSTPGSPTTPRPPSPRPGCCGGWSTGPTCSSRSRPRSGACRRSPPAWPRGSASTSP